MAAAADPVRTWFDTEGWQLDNDQLREELKRRDLDDETRVDWLDEAAVRREQRDATPDEPVAAFVEPGEYLIAALLLAGADGRDVSQAALDRARTAGVQAHMFPREHQRHIYTAIETVVDQGLSSEFMAVETELKRTGRLDQAGGPARVREIARLVPAVSNISTYAALLTEDHRRAEQQRLALELGRAAQNGGVTAGLRDQLIRILEPPLELAQAPEAVTAGAFILDEPTDIDAIRIWGNDTAIGWAAGEGLMLVGPDGVGKTTLGQQIALARAGLRTDALGMHVQADTRRVLLVSADRPRQAARSLRRMVTDTEREQLDQAITVWRGPLPQTLSEDRTILTRLAKQFDAGTVIVDSLKDVATDLASDESGGRIASSFQHLIASGVELLVMHHPRKPGVSDHRRPRELSDVYGSRLIFGVFGSVIMLWGEPGDVLVELRHLKQPIDELGPWNLRHDHPRGRTTIEHGTDLVDIVLQAGTAGLTAADAASLVYAKETPTRNEIERIRARLDTLVRTERLVKLPGIRGGQNGGEQARYLYNGPAQTLT